jgi:hypothetical protein
MNTAPLCSSLALTLFGASIPAQMEMRVGALYDRGQFRNAEPAVGRWAPDLVLTDLDGKPHALTQWTGRLVVVVKAGFT